MSLGNNNEIRPRTTGEIMDDGWRLYLANAPTLLLLSSIFYVPFAVLVLLLITTRPPENLLSQFVLPTLTALAIPLTGLGSSACQEALRGRPEGLEDGSINISVRSCMKSAFRDGLDHAAARVIVAALSLIALILFVLPGLTIWGGSGPLHAILASKESTSRGRGLFHAFRIAAQESQRQPGKVLALAIGRIFLLIFAVINLHTLALVGVWVSENLAGFDWAVLAAWLSLLHNPTYGVVLVLLAWLLLAPYSEAVNYLFHIDARARYEGLDLWHRARKHFRLPDKVTVASILIALGSVLTYPLESQAADALKSIRTARQKITAIRQEIKSKDPFPGGELWQAPLRQAAAHLDPDGNPDHGKYRWLHRAIRNFNYRNREDALAVLDDIDQKLGLIEENLAEQARADGIPEPENRSKEAIKDLLPKDQEESTDKPDPSKPERRRKADSRQAEHEVEVKEGQREHGSGFMAPASTTGLNTVAWIIFWGILIAVCVVAIVISWRNWTPNPKSVKPSIVEPTKPSLENLLAQADSRTVAELWRQADDLARHGQFLEAVRSLYLAALVLLHRSNRIRFEPTRTAGEYLDQLRPHKDLQESFRAMTGIFEMKWYGERVCRSEDFSSCRELAEAIRGQATENLS